jgi:Fe-S-cluster containining protein
MALNAFKKYQTLIAEVDRLCRSIRQGYGEHIACIKGCAGNCCQRHITVFPIEAVSFAAALQKLPEKMIHRIRHKARSSTTFGPCPLLEKGACLMYDSRAIICRTHGFPILNSYRGIRTIGFCQHNFKQLPAIPDEALIELAPLNNTLTSINRQFLEETAAPWPYCDRLTIGEALMLDV